MNIKDMALMMSENEIEQKIKLIEEKRNRTLEPHIRDELDEYLDTYKRALTLRKQW